MSDLDLYKILGVMPNADATAIKKAYRRLASSNHPDKNPGDKNAEARFKEATKAFSVLGDTEKRDAYDFNVKLKETSRNWGNKAARNKKEFVDDLIDIINRGKYGKGGSTHGHNKSSFQDPIIEDVEHFWHNDDEDEEESFPKPGEDVEEEIAVTFEESVFGCTKDIVSKSKVIATCESCSGTRTLQGTRMHQCGSCSGTGRKLDFRVGLKESSSKTCPACIGSGIKPAVPCPNCRGLGRKATNRKVRVRIPSGIGEGQRLRVAGMGSPGKGGSPGDLYVTVHLMPHETFQRKGNDLHISHSIPLFTAIKGGTVSIPVLGGKRTIMEVPPGIEPGKTVVTIEGEGIRSASGIKGDLHVTIQVHLPKDLSERGMKLLEELMDEINRTNVNWRSHV